MGKIAYVYKCNQERCGGPCEVVLNLGCANVSEEIVKTKLLGPIPKDSNSAAGHGHN